MVHTQAESKGSDDHANLARRLAFAGALLMTLGFLTGGWSALALTQKVKVDLPRLALSAHLNGVIGGLWLIAVASTVRYLHLGGKGLRWLGWFVLVPCWGNWAITILASVLGRPGISFTGEPKNDFVAILLHAVVVIPTFVGCGIWCWGFRAK